jgi:hypothetical protein
VEAIQSDLRGSMIALVSCSQFWAANSAVQMTSRPSTSHSSDSARRRWTSWARCSSADSGSSTSFTVTSEFSFLKASIAAP